MNFDKLKLPSDVPIAAGPNVFLRAEYQVAAGLSSQGASSRLTKLEAQGLVRKVRTRRAGKLLQAWEYLSPKKEVSA